MHKLIKRDQRLRAAALLGIRWLLGVVVFWQGFGKVFYWGFDQLWQSMFAAYTDTLLPEWLVRFAMYFTSYAELICGITLVLGLMRERTYYLLLSVLVIVAFGHGLVSPIWDLHHVVFRAVLLFSLMLLPVEWDRWSLDSFLFRR